MSRLQRWMTLLELSKKQLQILTNLNSSLPLETNLSEMTQTHRTHSQALLIHYEPYVLLL